MSIVLTKTINGKKVSFDLISLNGKTTIRTASYDKAMLAGLTKEEIKEAGFEIEGDK